MPPPSVQTLRYLRSWLTDRAPVREEEVGWEGPEGPMTGTWVVREDGRSAPPHPAWIALHGLTRTGRRHPSLVRFARALASASGGVLIPGVPEWIELRLAPGRTGPAIRGALDWLEDQPELRGGARGLVGFSFGAPQTLAAAGEPDIAARVDGVVGFGGYCDLERTIRYQLTGIHEWRGERYRHRPDPYGRWIVAGNYLPRVPGHEAAAPAAEALLALARRAGDRNVPSWDPSLNPTKRALRTPLDDQNRAIFDRLAALDGSDLDAEEGAALACSLARTAEGHDPLLAVRDRLEDTRVRVELLHGRHDHLIPFTEAYRVHEALSGAADPRLTVTTLFGHSAQDPIPFLRGVPEAVRFYLALTRVMAMVSRSP